MKNNISALVNYYLEQDYITECDINYVHNKILAILNLSDIEYIKVDGELYDSLNSLINYAVENNVITDTSFEREILEAQITDIFVDRPSIINSKFNSMDNIDARNWFLKLGVDTNYIKKNDIERNISFNQNTNKGYLELTINLSKPEKDPKEIALLKTVKSSSYPKCCLCRENVGFLGSANQAARTNHRVIDIKLNNRDFMFQYSPYMYYEEHCILIQKEHCDMVTNDETIKDHISFVEQFPGYFIGTNADIPIVGGSILNHNHYQGGNKIFPLDNAKVKEVILDGEIKVSYMDWYLTTLLIESNNKEMIIKYVNDLRNVWNTYENLEINIENNKVRHNAINIITRYVDGVYKVIVMLRNNKTTEELPFGIFHPDVNLHHVKKENIGLIEAMGVAILPGRLKTELEDIKSYILGEGNVSEQHLNWAKELKNNYNGEDIEQYVKKALTIKFEEVLYACNVLKYSSDDVKVIKEIIRKV